MKLTELLCREQLSLSFEVFPPKTDTAFESVKHATEEIAKLYVRNRNVHLIVDLSGDLVSVLISKGCDGSAHSRLCSIGIEHELAVFYLVFRHIDRIGVHIRGGSILSQHLFEGMLKPKLETCILICRSSRHVALCGVVR